jgi:signal transduction histidine kinase
MKPWTAAADYLVDEAKKLPITTDPAVVQFFSRKINIFFTLVALIMYSIAWPTLHLTHEVNPVLMPVVAAFAAFPIMLGWANPTLGWAISVVSSQVIGLTIDRVDGWDYSIQVVHLIELLVLTVLTYLKAPLRLLPVIWLVSAVVMFSVAPSNAEVGWMVGLAIAGVISVLIRIIVRSRTQLAQQTKLKDTEKSKNAVLEERTRIARDLHDVVAHRMSVVVVQSQTARYRIAGVGDAAAAEFDAIANVAREALDEVRTMLGVLRLEDDSAADALARNPNPGLAQIDGLISATRGAGIDVTYHPAVGTEQVGDACALVAYRIVQESLANATRYAAGAEVRVDITVAGGDLAVKIANTPPTSGPIDLESDGGQGIPGMIERAKAVGGVLSAAPQPDGGFVVQARLPLRAPGAAADSEKADAVIGSAEK